MSKTERALIILTIAALLMYFWSERVRSQREEEARHAQQAQRQLATQKTEKDRLHKQNICVDHKLETAEEANGLTKAGRPDDALALLKPCLFDMTAPEMLMARDRAQKAIEKATAQLAANEAKRKRNEGVSVGMTQEDVLSSNWGKPNAINRTATARGTREQWVYGGGNYLYFENSLLVSIQTRKAQH